MAVPSEVWLEPGPSHAAAADLLAARLGGRVGLAAVLADLDRSASPARVPGWAVDWGVALDDRDQQDGWYPQGITTSADAEAAGAESTGGRRVVLLSSYSHSAGDGARRACRVSVVDVTDPGRVRYAHVLLVRVEVDTATGEVRLAPLAAHAGGLLWVGGHLMVAATAKGVHVARLDDVLAAPAGDVGVLGLPPGRAGAFGHRYLLPVWRTYRGAAAPGTAPLRHSFLSLDHAARPGLLAGEYGRGAATRRLVRYPLDPVTGLPHAERSGAVPARHVGVGPRRMQGATVVEDDWYAGTSEGPCRGTVWAGGPERWVRHRWALPPGPEALCHWPGTGRLWCSSEHPGARFVFTVDLQRLR